MPTTRQARRRLLAGSTRGRSSSGSTATNCGSACVSTGSTLRWLERYDESLAILDRARQEFPGSDAVRVFRALTLNEAGRADEAVAELMTVVTTHAEVTDLRRYAGGLKGLAQWLADGRPGD